MSDRVTMTVRPITSPLKETVMKRSPLLWILIAVWLPVVGSNAAAADLRPNILWLSSEDHGQEMGCYGDSQATTPNVDALAKRGLMYRNVWSCAPVCAPARTTIITGMYAPSLGAEQMRSMVTIPSDVELLPTHMTRAGYYCSNRSKEDYNVTAPEKLWSESSGKAHWRNRAEGQPFFSVFNSTKSHESSIRNENGNPTHDPSKVRVPAYHPDTEISRRDWAIYYDTVTQSDAEAGKWLKELEADGLSESTIVFYWGDHGSGMPRSKRWPSDSGLRVPLVVYIPEAFAHLRPADYAAGKSTDRLVSFVDFAPTVMSLTGIKPAANMQGHAFAGSYIAEAPKYMYGFRGRMDERLDLVRSVSDGRFVYLRNYMPHLSQAQHVSYQFETPTTAEWKKLYDAGKTNDAQSIFWSAPKSPEELYDLQSDPDEVNNLASVPDHNARLLEIRRANRDHLLAIRDLGFVPEGQRFELADGRSLREMALDASSYPIERVIAAAELASNLEQNDEASIATLASYLKETNPTVRYWGTMGFLMRGEKAIASNTGALELIARDDASPENRVVALHALISGMGGDARVKAIATLCELATTKGQSVFTSMAALRALDELNAQRLVPSETALIDSSIDGMKVKVVTPDNRYDSYVPRLLESVLEKYEPFAAAVTR